MEAFDVVDLIKTKRDRGSLSTAQLDWLVDAYTRGYVADEQMSAMTMAIFLNGMSRDEIRDLTMAMIASGERLDFSGLSKRTTDKHSTGGVGDKITLPLAPLVAACGVAVPQLSGRGLGHTGGTLDKLESIPGWRAALSNEDMLRQLEDVGAVICAAGSGLAPADRKLYALRDVTGTVESIPLIASSIMSKKIAEGTGALVLDVKVGTGAFMKSLADAQELARTMVDLGTDAGVHTVALLTDMSTPLGLTAGNALEVAESVEVLAGGGPADVVDGVVEDLDAVVAVGGEGDDRGLEVRADHDPAVVVTVDAAAAVPASVDVVDVVVLDDDPLDGVAAVVVDEDAHPLETGREGGRGRVAHVEVLDGPVALVLEVDRAAPREAAAVELRQGTGAVVGEDDRVADGARALRVQLSRPALVGVEQDLVAGAERRRVHLGERLPRRRGARAGVRVGSRRRVDVIGGAGGPGRRGHRDQRGGSERSRGDHREACGQSVLHWCSLPV